MYPKHPYIGYKDETQKIPLTFTKQKQATQPGIEANMNPTPIFEDPNYVTSNKLKEKVAIISGGDSGIGKAVAILFAKEGADIVIAYYNESQDANNTKEIIENLGRKCLTIQGDLKDENFANKVVADTINEFGKVNILVNNCAVQFPQNSILDISTQQLKETFETNIYSYFFLTKAVLPNLTQYDSIINTTSVTAYEGNKELIDYSSTKGAISSFTRSMALSLADSEIRINQVAPGPIWTPLIVSTFDDTKIETFGNDVPLKRAGEPFEVAYSYLYLASDESRYVTGQTIHVNGGKHLS